MSHMLRLVLLIFQRFSKPTGYSTRHERDMECCRVSANSESLGPKLGPTFAPRPRGRQQGGTLLQAMRFKSLRPSVSPPSPKLAALIRAAVFPYGGPHFL